VRKATKKWVLIFSTDKEAFVQLAQLDIESFVFLRKEEFYSEQALLRRWNIQNKGHIVRRQAHYRTQ